MTDIGPRFELDAGHGLVVDNLLENVSEFVLAPLARRYVEPVPNRHREGVRTGVHESRSWIVGLLDDLGHDVAVYREQTALFGRLDASVADRRPFVNSPKMLSSS